MLRRALLLSFFLSLAVFSSAQETVFFSENPNAMLYTLPRTTLKIKVVTQKQSIKAGKFAPYAQKLLGFIAPLSDKDIYSVSSVELSSFLESDPTQIFSINTSDKTLAALVKQTGALPMPVSAATLEAETDYVTHAVLDGKNVTIDTISAIDKFTSEAKSDEQQAEELSEMIFTLRRRRVELITGDIGENVFGAGLKAALDEIRLLEQQYLSLFCGYSTITQNVDEYYVVPEKDKTNYVFARFSIENGLVPLTDLRAEPLVLQITPEQFSPLIHQSRADITPVNSKEVIVTEMFKYRVAAPTKCDIYLNSQVLLQSRAQIYQFGAVVDIPFVVDTKK